MNPVALVMLGVGALMVWSGVTDRDPLTVVKDVLTGKGVTPTRELRPNLLNDVLTNPGTIADTVNRTTPTIPVPRGNSGTTGNV